MMIRGINKFNSPTALGCGAFPPDPWSPKGGGRPKAVRLRWTAPRSSIGRPGGWDLTLFHQYGSRACCIFWFPNWRAAECESVYQKW